MKLTAILLLAAALQVSATGYGQRITLTLKNASLEKAIAEIEKQSSFSFVYGKEQLAQAKTIDLTVSNEKLESVLDLVFKDQPLTYTISGKYIAIRQKIALPLTGDNKQEALPPIDVHGRVVNDNGQPVEGAIVTVKGTNKYVATNANGEFTLTGVDGNATLVVSAVNIETYEIKVAGRTELAINVKAKVTTGDVVTVEANTGYQKVKPNEITGSIVVVTNEQLNRTVSTNILDRLNGTAPGLLYNGGTAGINSLIIRSQSTIFGDATPLIVVDNFPYDGDISSINPNDVESITILKDAGAAAIWGIKAGNGVIVITTKSGKYNQATRVSINSNITITGKTDLFSAPRMSIGDYIDLENYLFDQGHYDGAILDITQPWLSPAVEILLKKRNGQLSDADAKTQIEALKNYDVRNDLGKYFYRKPVSQQYAINLSGGGTRQKYYVSAGWDKNLEAKNGNEFSRLSLIANNTYALLKNKLEITSGVIYSQNNNKFNNTGSVNYPYARLIDDAGNSLPVARYRQGYIDTAGGGKLLDWNYRPLDELRFSDNKTTGTRYRINIGLNYKLIRGLDIDLKFQYGKELTENRDHHSIETFFTRDLINKFYQPNATNKYPVPLGGILAVNNSLLTFKNFRSQINYKRAWKNRHEVSGLFGAEIGEKNLEGMAYGLYGYDGDRSIDANVDYVNSYNPYIPGSAQRIPRNSNISSLTDRNVSVYLNGTYTYNKRYNLSVSARRDATNLLGVETNRKWTPLWSVGAGWNISYEPFYNIKWLPILKLRATYGYQGNVNNSIAALLTTAQSTPNRWGSPNAVIRNPPNSTLRWEKSAVLNIGIDYALKGNIVSGTIDYYRKKGTDLIGVTPTSPSLGVSIFKGNTSDMKGEGFDFSIETHNINKAFKWSTNFWFSYAKDRVTNYKSKLTNLQGYIETGDINPIEGRPVNAIYSYKWAGLDPLTGDPQGYLDNAVSKDYYLIQGISDLSQMVYSGPSVPTFFGALRNTIEWKGLALSFNITYKLGHYFRRSSVNYNNLFYSATFGNKDFAQRWRQPGDELNTNVPSLVYPPDYARDAFYQYSEILVEKADHVRLQDIQLAYNIPERVLTKKIGIRSLKIYFNASNLGIIWRANKLKLDPDLNQSDDTITSPKLISAGVKIEL